MSVKWKIRFLGGELHGREVWITDNQLTIGERDCDLCLPLDNEGHIVFRVIDDSLYIDATSPCIKVNGRKHRANNPLPQEGVIQGMGIALAFGNQDASLSRYRPPSGMHLMRRWLGAAVAAIGMTVAFLTLGNSVDMQETTQERVKTVFKQPGLEQLNTIWSPEGTLHIEGYVKECETVRTLRQKLNELDVLYQDSVICAGELENTVHDLLVQEGYVDAIVSSPKPGEVLIQGDISSGKRWDNVQSLLADIPGLKSWKTDNPHRIQAQTLIDSLIDGDMAHLVSVTAVGKKFVISGVLSANQLQAMDTILVKVRKQCPEIKLNYQSIPFSREGTNPLISSATAIVHGKKGIYLLLKNGTRLQVGSLLPDESRVVAINEKTIAVRGSETLKNYPLNL